MRFTSLTGLIVMAALTSFAAPQAQDVRAENREAKSPIPPQKTEPPQPEARADIYMARKMYREAAETYQQVKPATHIILNKVGIAYHQMGELDTAKRFYERSINADPGYPEAINNLGTIHYAKKSYRRAISAYKKALKLSPDS